MSNVIGFPNTNVSTHVPEFIQPADLTQLSDEQIDVILDGIRIRRMQKLTLYKQTQALKEEAKERNLEDKLNKKLAQFFKALDTSNKQEEKLTKLANEVRGLRIQLGQDPL